MFSYFCSSILLSTSKISVMKKSLSRENLIFIAVILFICLIWMDSWILIDTFVAESNRSDFGNKFGAVNSLFSALALAVILYSIRLQQTELKLQREELSDTRKEFREQNFKTTFFNLLHTQQQISGDIKISISYLTAYNKAQEKNIEGKLFFINSKIELIRITTALKIASYQKFNDWDEYDAQYDEPNDQEDEDRLFKHRIPLFTLKYYKITEEEWNHSKTLNPIDFAKLCYVILNRKFQYAVGHYFRHLYHILLFLEETENQMKKGVDEETVKEIESEFKRYANFVQAQMNIPELFLTYYNCLHFDKSRRLIVKYGLLENLNIEDLLSPEHLIEGINLKSIANIK